jgi:hypothetical protein
MAVNMRRTGNTLTVTVEVDIADIVAQVGTPAPERKILALQRAADHLQAAVSVGNRTDAEIDRATTAAQADAARLKAARAGGNL